MNTNRYCKCIIIIKLYSYGIFLFKDSIERNPAPLTRTGRRPFIHAFLGMAFWVQDKIRNGTENSSLAAKKYKDKNVFFAFLIY